MMGKTFGDGDINGNIMRNTEDCLEYGINDFCGTPPMTGDWCA